MQIWHADMARSAWFFCVMRNVSGPAEVAGIERLVVRRLCCQRLSAQISMRPQASLCHLANNVESKRWHRYCERKYARHNNFKLNYIQGGCMSG